MNRLPDELQAKIDAGIEALVRDTLGTHYEPLIDDKLQEIEGKQRELEDLRREYAQAVESYVQRSRGAPTMNPPLGMPTPEQNGTDHAGEDHAAQNGSTGTPTRRVMLLSVLPELRGAFFKRRDVDERIVRRWPDAEPKTPAEYKNFTSANARLLTDLVDKGQLEAKKGEGTFDPTQYRVLDNDEDTLLRSGP